MAFEQRDNSGALFKNDKEGGNANWPDYKGTAMIDGKTKYISAWIKDGKKGKFMSLSFQAPGERTKEKAQKEQVDPDDDGSIPF